jgi:hypothetical protein
MTRTRTRKKLMKSLSKCQSHDGLTFRKPCAILLSHLFAPPRDPSVGTLMARRGGAAETPVLSCYPTVEHSAQGSDQLNSESAHYSTYLELHARRRPIVNGCIHKIRRSINLPSQFAYSGFVLFVLFGIQTFQVRRRSGGRQKNFLAPVRPALPLTMESWNHVMLRSRLLHCLVSLIATTLILQLPFTLNIPVLSSSDVLVYLPIDSMCSGCRSHCLVYSYV